MKRRVRLWTVKRLRRKSRACRSSVLRNFGSAGKRCTESRLPPEIGRSFLIRAIAYRLQEQAYGGLKPSTRRLLARAAEESATGLIEETAGPNGASGNHPDPRMARERSPGDDARRRRVLQRETLPFALRSRARDHRQSVVGTAVLRIATHAMENNHASS